HQVGADQAESGEQTRMRGHDDLGRVHQVQHRGQQHRARRAVGDQAVVARVDTVLDGDVGDALGDVVDADVERVADALVERQRAVQVLERLLGQVRVQPHPATGEAVRVDDAHQQAGVGGGRLL